MALGATDFLGFTSEPCAIKCESSGGSVFATISTSVLYLNVLVEKLGSGITLYNTPEYGTRFRVNRTGKYALNASMSTNGTALQGFVKNTTVSPDTLSSGDPRRLTYTQSVSSAAVTHSRTLTLFAGDEVVFTSTGSPSAAPAATFWASIEWVGEP